MRFAFVTLAALFGCTTCHLTKRALADAIALKQVLAVGAHDTCTIGVASVTISITHFPCFQYFRICELVCNRFSSTCVHRHLIAASFALHGRSRIITSSNSASRLSIREHLAKVPTFSALLCTFSCRVSMFLYLVLPLTNVRFLHDFVPYLW